MTAPKKILLLGSGMVVKNMVDYFLDTCHYDLTILDFNVKQAEGLIKGRKNGKVIFWDAVKNFSDLEGHVKNADIAVCMLPWKFDSLVAEVCVKLKKNFLNTNAITPAMQALDAEAKKAGVLLMTESGAEPGIDHMLNKYLIDSIRKEGGKVTEVCTLCGGLPAMEFNNNPMLYKFFWSPMGVIWYCQEEARYLVQGKETKIEGSKLMEDHKLIDVEGVGTFEVFPNGVVLDTVKPYELKKEEISYYRGTLRFIGFCNTWKRFLDLGIFEFKEVIPLKEVSFPQFLANQIHVKYEAGKTDMAKEMAKYWGVPLIDDNIKKMAWLGLFDPHNIIPLEKGTRAEAMLSLLIPKLSIGPTETDWLLLYTYAVGEFAGKPKEKRVAVLQSKGIPGAETAMCRAVSFSAAVTTKLILEGFYLWWKKEIRLEGKIKSTGLQIPTDPTHYTLALEELKKLGISIEMKVIKM